WLCAPHDGLQASDLVVQRHRAAVGNWSQAPASGDLRRLGASARRRGPASDRNHPPAHSRVITYYSDRLSAELRHANCGATGGGNRHLAQYAAAAARGVRDEWNEGGAQRRPQLECARRLVGRSSYRRRHGDPSPKRSVARHEPCSTCPRGRALVLRRTKTTAVVLRRTNTSSFKLWSLPQACPILRT